MALTPLVVFGGHDSEPVADLMDDAQECMSSCLRSLVLLRAEIEDPESADECMRGTTCRSFVNVPNSLHQARTFTPPARAWPPSPSGRAISDRGPPFGRKSNLSSQ